MVAMSAADIAINAGILALTFIVLGLAIGFGLRHHHRVQLAVGAAVLTLVIASPYIGFAMSQH
jgi:hypothetical protein